MKKWIRVLVSVFLLGNILCSSGVWAIQEPEIGIGSDTYDTFHREIEQKIKGIYCRYSSEAASIRAEMGGKAPPVPASEHLLQNARCFPAGIPLRY